MSTKTEKALSQRLVDIATGVALTSEGIGKRNSYRLGAIIFDKKRVLCAKPNIRKTHTVLSKFSKFPYLHAETNCILSHGLDNCNGKSLLVVRVAMDDCTLRNSLPCAVCSSMIKLAGIKKVYYSNNEGEIKCL